MTILAATDRSENSRAALKLAARLAERLSEQLVVFVSLELWERDAPEILPTFEDVVFQPSEHARKLVHEFVADALGEGVQIKIDVGHPPAEAIMAAADELDASLIVAGTCGHSKIVEAFFGSTLSALARRANQPLLAVPPEFDAELRTILAPVDFSECSEASLQYAAELASKLGAQLLVQHSTPYGVPAIAPPFVYVPDNPDDDLVASRDRLAMMIERLGLTDRVAKQWADLGPPHPDILYAAKEHNVDLIVMGTHGRSGAAHFLLGSTAERILRDRTRPVLIVRRAQ